MSDPDPNMPQEDRLDRVLDEYYQRLDRGESIDRDELVHRYPDLSEQLRAFFQSQDASDATRPIVGQAGEPLPVLRYFGDYELLQELGRGGMGVVYKARQSSLNRLVAVKMILAAGLANQAEIERFYLEARTAGQLKHPRIVPIHEVGEHRGQHFFSMDYVAGVNLAALVRENPLPPQRAAELLQKITEAVHFAHEKGVLHRDLKPSNVLLDQSGEPHIADFGLARRIESSTGLTVTDQVLGTPSYMSPEQAEGRPVTRATDVYALGAILYELLTGRPPHRAENPYATIDLVLHSEPVAPRLLNPRLPRDLETICLKCLSREPSRRYERAEHLADDLGRYLRHEPILARPTGKAERLWRWCQRNPALATAIAAAALALGTALVLAVVFLVSERIHSHELSGALHSTSEALRQSQHRLAESEFDQGLALCQKGEVGRGMLWLARSLNTAPAESKDLQQAVRLNLDAWERELVTLVDMVHDEGKVVSVVYSPDGRPFVSTQRGIRPLDSGSADPGSEVDWSTPKWRGASREPLAVSSDGRSLIGKAVGDANTVQLWRDEDPPQTLQHESFKVLSAAFASDDRILLAGIAKTGVAVWNGTTGEQVFEPRRSELDHVPLSADGSLLLTCPKPNTAQIWEVSSAAAQGPRLTHDGRITRAIFSNDGKLAATGDQKGVVQVWNTADGKALAEPLDLGAEVRGLEFSEDRESLFCVGIYRCTKWNWETGERKDLPADNIAYAADARFAPSGERAITASSLSAATYFDDDKPLSLRRQRLDHGGQIERVAITANGILATSGRDQVVRLWKAPPGRQAGPAMMHPSRLEHGSRLHGAAFTPDGRKLYTLSWDGRVRIWNTETSALIADLFKSSHGGLKLLLSPNGKQGFIGSDQSFGHPSYKSGWLWNTEDGRAIGEAVAHKDGIIAARFSRDGRLIITASWDGTALVSDTTTGRPVAGPLSHPGDRDLVKISTVDLSLDGKTAVTGSTDGSARLWIVSTGAMIGHPLRHEGEVTVARFSADGGLLLTAGRDDTARLWQAPLFDAAGPPLLHGDDVNDAVFSPSGKEIATAGNDGTVQFWEVETGKRIGQPLQHSAAVGMLQYLEDGRLLLACSKDGPRLWDVVTRRPVGPEYGGPGQASAVALATPSRRFAAYGSESAQLWEIPVGMQGDPNEIIRRVQVHTGMELEADGVFRSLEPARWRQLRAERSRPEK